MNHVFMIFAIVVIIVCHFELWCQWSDPQGLRQREVARPTMHVATRSARHAQLRWLPVWTWRSWGVNRVAHIQCRAAAVLSMPIRFAQRYKQRKGRTQIHNRQSGKQTAPMVNREHKIRSIPAHPFKYIRCPIYMRRLKVSQKPLGSTVAPYYLVVPEIHPQGKVGW